MFSASDCPEKLSLAGRKMDQTPTLQFSCVRELNGMEGKEVLVRFHFRMASAPLSPACYRNLS
jgi:hypothetical protein